MYHFIPGINFVTKRRCCEREWKAIIIPGLAYTHSQNAKCSSRTVKVEFAYLRGWNYIHASLLISGRKNLIFWRVNYNATEFREWTQLREGVKIAEYKKMISRFSISGCIAVNCSYITIHTNEQLLLN